MPTTKNGSVIVNYDIRGTGPAAILFNHSGTSNLSWSERFLEALADELTVITPDHRGTGRSSHASVEFSLADLAADGRAVLDEERIDEAVIIDTSMGGCVAQEFTLGFPQRVSSLVLMG
ncbi:MAG: alpha/beta hydrolase, partial [Gammaproteobacteria bacterium]|nr:alpha/beta hydrolase [Gammaproteobacteria bacterium]